MATPLSQEDRPSRLTQNVNDTLDKCKNCAQTSFSVLSQEFNLDGGAILKALTPFPGIALRGETCGAITGCLMAIGLVYGRDNLDDWKGYVASLPPSRRFCRRFEEEHGSTACADLLETKLGVGMILPIVLMRSNMLSPEERKRAAKSSQAPSTSRLKSL